jgi:hypothetical protein
MMTGSIAEIPPPHLRKFPSDTETRKVTVTISRWGGIWGGGHYHITLREEPNPVWDSRNRDYGDHSVIGWRTPEDDLDGMGREFKSVFKTQNAAQSWARGIISTHFENGQGHYEIIKMGGIRCRWFYKREGD